MEHRVSKSFDLGVSGCADKEYYVGLNLTSLNVYLKKKLIDFYGKDLRYLFEQAGASELQKDFLLNERQAKHFIKERDKALEKGFKEIEKANESGVKLFRIYDKNYPEILEQLPDPPIVLYYKGESDLNRAGITIVGSRAASESGLQNAYKLGYDMGKIGFNVVSGLAIGIDASAHRGALESGGETIAVLGSGLDVLYPKPNKDLCEAIIKRGAIISEYPFGTPPMRRNFPIRNRIMCGLSLGIVVVEARRKSGVMHTAKYALEYGREVYAYPGPALSEYSGGSNYLIKEGAKLIEGSDNLLEDLSLVIDIDTLRLDEGDRGVSDNALVLGEANNGKEGKGRENSLVESEGVGGVVTLSDEVGSFSADAIVEKLYMKYKLGSDERKIIEVLKGGWHGFDIIVEGSKLSAGRVMGVLRSLVLQDICLKEGNLYSINSSKTKG